MNLHINIRLYGYHDYDLLAYYYQENTPLKLDDIVRTCVIAYVRKEEVTIPPPLKIPSRISTSREVRMCVTFYENTEPDVIEWIESIEGGLRNIALKVITRSYIDTSYYEDLFANTRINAEDFDVLPEREPVNNSSKQQTAIADKNATRHSDERDHKSFNQENNKKESFGRNNSSKRKKNRNGFQNKPQNDKNKGAARMQSSQEPAQSRVLSSKDTSDSTVINDNINAGGDDFDIFAEISGNSSSNSSAQALTDMLNNAEMNI